MLPQYLPLNFLDSLGFNLELKVADSTPLKFAVEADFWFTGIQ